MKEIFVIVNEDTFQLIVHLGFFTDVHRAEKSAIQLGQTPGFMGVTYRACCLNEITERSEP
jgi:hypothetical protein